MAGFGSGLASFGTGMEQGQTNATDLRQKMMQIQQMQMLLDQAKKETAATILNANAYRPGATQNPAAMPAPPGGTPASPPMSPGGPPPMGPAAPQSGGPPSPWSMGPPPPQRPGVGPQAPITPMPGAGPPQQVQPQPRPMGGMPPGGMQTPGGPSASPASSGGQGDTLQSMTQLINSGALDPDKAVAGIYERLWKANPDADPETIGLAAEQAVNMMHQMGLDPATKFYLQSALQSQRDAYGLTKQGMADTSRENIAGANIAGREKIAGENIAGRETVAGENIAGRENVANINQGGAMARTKAEIASHEKIAADTQRNINARQAAGLASKAITQERQIKFNRLKAKADQAQRAYVASLNSTATNAADIQSKLHDDWKKAQKEMADFSASIPAVAKPPGKAQPQDRGASVDLIHTTGTPKTTSWNALP